jgi:replicative DNA helicase
MEEVEAVSNISTDSHKARKMSEIASELRDDMDKAFRGVEEPFHETSYIQFDSEIGGLVENGLTVIAGRPSMGKSSFTSGPIEHSLMKDEHVVLYSMEVADKNALSRLVSFRSQEPLSNIKKGSLSDFEKFNEAMKFFESQDDALTIVDRSGMDRRELELDIIKRIKRDPKMRLIVVDHLLQIHIDPSRHAPTELGGITKMLKRIAQNYRITVLLLSQLNRSVESRDNKRPMMADLQGSGSIEQNADMIIFLYRSEYYKEKEWDQEKNGPYERKQVEQAEVIVGKNRDGPTGSVEIPFRAKTASFLRDYIPASVTEYIDDDYDYSNEEKHEQKASVKEKDDTIEAEIEDNDNLDMPLI